MNRVGIGDGETTRADSFEGHRSMASVEDIDVGDTCRICRGEATADQPLFYPCKCSGSIRYVHQECLLEWLSHSQKKYCELCKTSFRFTKLYDQSMPDTLPLPLFVRQIVRFGARALGRWLRYFVVIVVWTCCLPWVIRQIWRGLFWLADGSWMSEHELQQMLTANGSSDRNLSSNATSLGLTTATQTVAVPQLSLFSTIMSLFNGDALLRGLLRLASSNTFVVSPLTTNLNATANVPFLRPPPLRRPSLLSDVQSLNAFTQHVRVNNTLIDILEGQLICLSVIAAFILVFLIREWVINQQPIHMMPDPDQGEVLPAVRPQNEELRQAARRRRLHVRRVEGQPDLQAPEIAQRPRAVPRQRRLAVPERPGDQTPVDGQDLNFNFPVRNSSLQRTDSGNEMRVNGNDLNEDTPIHADQDPAWIPLNVQSPPLERGIFDDAVSIRRNIEENPGLQQSESLQASQAGWHSNATDSGVQIHEQPEPPSQTFDFATFAGRNESREFTFSPSTALEQPFVANSEQMTQDRPTDLDSTNEITEDQAVPELDTTGSSDHPPLIDLPESTDIVVDEQNADGNAEANLPVPDATSARDRDIEENIGVLAKLANWLWGIDDNTTNPAAPPRRNSTPNEMADLLDAGHAPVIQVARAVPAPAAAPIPAAEPMREPNVQFGVDLNDPNAIDDAEDLEGILELIGMEGPIAGMVQNLIFSVFLITLTLSASVWCPYIWGKIALLVMSHPIGVFVKAPLYLMSRTADMVVDLSLLILGVLGLVMTNTTKLMKYMVVMLVPKVGQYISIDTLEKYAVKVTQTSSFRLEKALSVTLFHLRPDLPTFSMQSHHALRIFQAAFSDVGSAVSRDLLDTVIHAQILWQSNGMFFIPVFIFREITAFPVASLAAAKGIAAWLVQLSADLRLPSFNSSTDIDLSLIDWSTKDKIIAIFVGYVFFAILGSAYLKIVHLFTGLRKDEKVEGVFADSLRQAGGVMKVIFIIGIEMILFPLYCGFLLDMALLPLFKDATVANRVQFVTDAPITGLFVHWFIGTCYMFHFALFVSMCRKILRKGVLYFIRDPDDPTFHPVRDVLERPVLTQLNKIAFSALVYGGLVLLCLGGVIWTISGVGRIFPIQWATNEPRLAFPVDVIFFNFLLPLAVRTAEPSKKITTMYDWWFRKCARFLRLSHFLFGDKYEDEMDVHSQFPQRLGIRSLVQPSDQREGSREGERNETAIAGYWVRAPASDAVRIPKGTRVFLEVDQNNNRLDGKEERAKGLHGQDDERFAKIFVPGKFRVRVAVFIFLVWLFAACTGAAATLGPLLLGRATLYVVSGSKYAPNDLYAFTVGLHLSGVLFLIARSIHRNRLLSRSKWISLASDMAAILSQALIKARYFAGLIYLTITIGLLIPILLSLVAELYVHMPVYGYLVTPTKNHRTSSGDSRVKPAATTSPPIHLAQSWTLGVLLLRLVLRASVQYPSPQSPLAQAVRAIIRNGVLHPDVALASRALILPLLSTSILLLALPVILAQGCIRVLGISPDDSMDWYRHSYPVLLLTALAIYSANRMGHKIESWQVRVRDEIYLVGERLHNFTDVDPGKEQLKDPKYLQGDDQKVTAGSVEMTFESAENAGSATGRESEPPLRHRGGHPNDTL